jgi:predicted NBD/HSP70 family sugar kinase
MALGELTFGKGNDYDNMICINVGYGIGAGIIINKKLFYGTDGMAGEFGHVPVTGDNLITCPCGNKTCLTAYSSGDAIAQRARLMMEERSSEVLMNLCLNIPENITAKMVVEAALQKDELANEVFQQSIHHLGLSIAGLINTFNPQVIFIGGGMAQNGNFFWEPLKEIIQKNVFDRISKKYQVLPVTFLDRAAMYGAVGLVIKEILNMDI